VIGLEDSAVTFKDHMPEPCNGYYYFGNHTWRCWVAKEGKSHGSLDLTGAIAQSCDVYFYQLGQKLAISRLVAGGLDMGFANKTGVDFPEEKPPRFPHGDLNAYYNSRFGAGNWTPQSEILNLAIGQGANSQSVLTMARFYAALATDGLAPRPHFVRTSVDTTRVFTLDSATMLALRRGLIGVLSAGGTAAASAIQGIPVAGKTGTAQSGKHVNGTELNHAWFVGFAPSDSPKIVVAVLIEFGGHGPRAAHIATAIMEHYLHLPLHAVETGG
jgi:penicillin-binding protein 2